MLFRTSLVLPAALWFVALGQTAVCMGAYKPSAQAYDWPKYSPVAEWPSQAGTPLPRLYMEPRMTAPYKALPKDVSKLHCDYLIGSNIHWIVFLGDSVARAAGVAMMEHLAGDDNHFCDPKDAPEAVRIDCFVLLTCIALHCNAWHCIELLPLFFFFFFFFFLFCLTNLR